jgi:hypothetical protein
MAKRRAPGAGRPSKGQRKVMATRVPLEIAELVTAEAERLDLAFSDVIANALAEHFGLPPVTSPAGEDQMKLIA